MHDAYALKLYRIGVHRSTHTTNLVLLTFREGDRELPFAKDFYLALFCDIAADIDAFFHMDWEARPQVYGSFDAVFLFVLKLRVEQAVSDAAIVGEDNQSVGILVEPPDREDTLQVHYITDAFLFALGRVCDDVARLVIGVVTIRPLGLSHGDRIAP